MIRLSATLRPGRAAHARAVFGDVRHAALDRQRGRFVADVLAADQHAGRWCIWRSPVITWASSLCPLPATPADPHDFAGAHLEREARAAPAGRGRFRRDMSSTDKHHLAGL